MNTQRQTGLLGAVDSQMHTLRDGADIQVLFYWWRKQGWADTDFVQATQRLLGDGLIEQVPHRDQHVRLTDAGMMQQRATLPEQDAQDSESTADDEQWMSGMVRKPGAPKQDLQAVVRDIFDTVKTRQGRSISAASMAQIWRMENQRGGELRKVLDGMLASGELTVERGPDGTRFALANAG